MFYLVCTNSHQPFTATGKGRVLIDDIITGHNVKRAFLRQWARQRRGQGYALIEVVHGQTGAIVYSCQG